eukprot:scaffold16356_cov63-Phaeocystis_antarctica.AAC.1
MHALQLLRRARAPSAIFLGQHVRTLSVAITERCAQLRPPLSANHLPEREKKRGDARADAAPISRAGWVLRIQLQVRDDRRKRYGGRGHVRAAFQIPSCTTRTLTPILTLTLTPTLTLALT